jgi:hypothetical protein
VQDEGWLVRVEVDAGKGEITPIVLALALSDHRAAVEAACNSPDVARLQGRPRTGGQAWPISKVDLIAPIDARTIAQLGLRRGESWNVYDPPLTSRIG